MSIDDTGDNTPGGAPAADEVGAPAEGRPEDGIPKGGDPAADAGGVGADGAAADGPDSAAAGESWRDALPDDVRTHPFFKEFKSIADLGGWALNAEKALGKKGLIPPDPKADPETRQAFYQSTEYRRAFGVPDAPDGYEIPVPDNVEPTAFDAALHESAKAAAHKWGLSPAQLAGLTTDAFQPVIDQFTQEAVGRMNQARADLQKEWGAEYDRKVAAATDAAQQMFGDRWEEVRQKRFADGSFLIDDPDVVRIFADRAEVIGEDRMVKGGRDGHSSPHAAREEYDRLRHSEAYRDRKHPEHRLVNEKVDRLVDRWGGKWREAGLA